MDSLSRRLFLASTAAGLGLGAARWSGASDSRALAAAEEGTRAPESPRQPRADPWQWRLLVGGAVRVALRLSLQDCFNLATRVAVLRLTAPSGQTSVALWEGVHLSTLLRLAETPSPAPLVRITCADGHTDLFTVADLMRPRALFAFARQGMVLGPEQGGPLRLVIPWRTTDRSPVGITQLEFLTEAPSGPDPLRGALAAGEQAEVGLDLGAEHGWSAEVRAVEIVGQDAGPGRGEVWEPLPYPFSPADAERVDEMVRALDDASFLVANQSRTHLVLLGEAGVAGLMRAARHGPGLSPLSAPQIDARLFAHNALAEVNSPLAVEPLVQGLGDESPLVAALCLDALARRRHPEALVRALGWVQAADDGLAVTAIAAVGALAPSGDAAAQERLAAARARTTDPTRVAELDRALGQVAPR